MQDQAVRTPDTDPDQPVREPVAPSTSMFSAMRINPASAEYTDCDGGCDDGNIDDY